MTVLPFGFSEQIEFAVIVAAATPALLAFFGQQYNTDSIYRYYAGEVVGAPPGWVYGVVWPVLYSLLAASLACLVLEDVHGNSDLIVLSLFQFLLLLVWPRLFWKELAFKTALIVLLDAWFVAAIIGYVSFDDHNYLTAATQLSLFLWLTYAAYLNYAGLQFQSVVISVTKCRQDIRDLEDAECMHHVCTKTYA